MKKGRVQGYTDDGDVVATFYSIKRKGDKLLVEGKALDVMEMDMVLPPEEVLKGMKLILSWAVISYVLLLPYFGLKRMLSKKREVDPIVWTGKGQS